MGTWSELSSKKGVYISPPFNVNSDFEYYIHNFRSQFEENDGTVDIFIRVSYDGVNYGEWDKINNDSISDLFRDDFYYLEYAKFQYKVEMTINGEVSPVFKGFSYDLFGAYLIDNKGDVICKPEIWIKKTNASGDISLTNETNGQTLILKNLNKDETVYIDCEKEDIVSSLANVYRFKDHNDVFLELEVGENLITGEGDFELVVRHEFKLLQG